MKLKILGILMATMISIGGASALETGTYTGYTEVMNLDADVDFENVVSFSDGTNVYSNMTYSDGMNLTAEDSTLPVVNPSDMLPSTFIGEIHIVTKDATGDYEFESSATVPTVTSLDPQTTNKVYHDGETVTPWKFVDNGNSGYVEIDSIKLMNETEKNYSVLWNQEKVTLKDSSTSKVFEASELNKIQVNASFSENASGKVILKKYNESEKIGESEFNLSDGINSFDISTGNASNFEAVVKSTDKEINITEILIDGKSTGGYTSIFGASPTSSNFIVGGLESIFGFVDSIISSIFGWLPF